MSAQLVRYCPGSAAGTPAWMNRADAENQAYRDTTSINILVKVDSIDKPVCYPHIGGTCSKCKEKHHEAVKE